jgi:hypothetical protein
LIGANIVNGVEFDVEFKVLMKLKLLFCKGPVIKDVNVESSGYPEMAYVNMFQQGHTSRSEIEAFEFCADAKATKPATIAVNNFMIILPPDQGRRCIYTC